MIPRVSGLFPCEVYDSFWRRCCDAQFINTLEDTRVQDQIHLHQCVTGLKLRVHGRQYGLPRTRTKAVFLALTTSNVNVVQDFPAPGKISGMKIDFDCY